MDRCPHSTTPPRRADSRLGPLGSRPGPPASASLGVFRSLCLVASFPSASTLALFFLSPLPRLHRLKAELAVTAQTQSTPEGRADQGEVGSLGWKRGGQRGRQNGRACPRGPSGREFVGGRAPPGAEGDRAKAAAGSAA